MKTYKKLFYNFLKENNVDIEVIAKNINEYGINHECLSDVMNLEKPEFWIDSFYWNEEPYGSNDDKFYYWEVLNEKWEKALENHRKEELFELEQQLDVSYKDRAYKKDINDV